MYVYLQSMLLAVYGTLNTDSQGERHRVSANYPPLCVTLKKAALV